MHKTGILIVDDQLDNINILISCIENISRDYNIFRANSGSLALEICRKKLPDCIITDWDMPEMSGIELIKRLKEDKETTEIPVIMCTGVMLTSDNLRTALEAGAFDYIRKPVDKLELEARLRSALRYSTSIKSLKSERKQFLDLLNAIPQPIYVSDFETAEILFMNTAKREIFGNDLIGKICYKSFHNRDLPCDICQKKHLNENSSEVVQWEHYYSTVQRHFINTDKVIIWQDGRKAKFQVSFDLTDIKKKELEIKILSTAIEQNPATIAITDTCGNIQYVNPKFTELTGYTFNEALGRNPRVLKSGKTDERIFKELWQTITAGKIWTGEFVNKKKNGEEFIERAIISPIFDDTNNIVRYLAIKEDITIQKQIEQNLIISKQKLKEAQQIAQLGNWEYDLVNNILDWSDEIYRIFDCLPDEFEATYDSFLQFVHPDDRQMVNNEYLNSLKNKQPYELIHRIISKTGKIKYVKEKCETIFDDNEKPIISKGIVLDITDLKEKEIEIFRMSEKYRQAQAVGNVGHWEYFIQTNHLKWSEQTYNIYEVNHDSFIVNFDNTVELFHPEDRETVIDEFNKSVINKTDFEFTHRIVSKHGNIKYVTQRAKTYYDEKGNPVSSLGTVQDVTVLKISELQLKELNATKDKFFSILAHDLKNPFNSLIGYSDLLIRNAKDYDTDRIILFAKNMYSASNSAYTLLENLLEWSRIQTGKLQPRLIELLPSLVISDAKLHCDSIAKAKNIMLDTAIHSNHKILADFEMLKTVLRNLITNAIKFTHAGGNVKIECTEKDNVMFFKIIDNGIGIAPEYVSKLFKIESKLSKSGTANEKGTGLGLILCKEFIEKQNGIIGLKSELNKGSEFYFTIPLASTTN